ncbi:MAG: hypothetical protein MJ252_08650, partial [archaeon]|nr:hypothetical protein [archaeon]
MSINNTNTNSSENKQYIKECSKNDSNTNPNNSTSNSYKNLSHFEGFNKNFIEKKVIFKEDPSNQRNDNRTNIYAQRNHITPRSPIVEYYGNQSNLFKDPFLSENSQMKYRSLNSTKENYILKANLEQIPIKKKSFTPNVNQFYNNTLQNFEGLNEDYFNQNFNYKNNKNNFNLSPGNFFNDLYNASMNNPQQIKESPSSGLENDIPSFLFGSFKKNFEDLSPNEDYNQNFFGDLNKCFGEENEIRKNEKNKYSQNIQSKEKKKNEGGMLILDEDNKNDFKFGEEDFSQFLDQNKEKAKEGKSGVNKKETEIVNTKSIPVSINKDMTKNEDIKEKSNIEEENSTQKKLSEKIENTKE